MNLVGEPTQETRPSYAAGVPWTPKGPTLSREDRWKIGGDGYSTFVHGRHDSFLVLAFEFFWDNVREFAPKAPPANVYDTLRECDWVSDAYEYKGGGGACWKL